MPKRTDKIKIKKILVSQPKPASIEKSPYGSLAEKHKLKLEFQKFIKIEGIPAKDFRKEKISILDYSAIIFTSRHAVDHFFRIAEEMRVEIPDTLKYFCVSESTAFYLQKYVQYRKRKIFHGKYNFKELMEILNKHKDEKYLLPVSETHKQSMIKLLNESKINYKKACLYRTVANDLTKINISKFDLVIFFSPSGVRSLLHNFPDYKQNGTVIAAFGPTTTKAVKEAGLELNITAPTKTAPSMTMAIDEFIVAEKKKK